MRFSGLAAANPAPSPFRLTLCIGICVENLAVALSLYLGLLLFSLANGRRGSCSLQVHAVIHGRVDWEGLRVL